MADERASESERTHDEDERPARKPALILLAVASILFTIAFLVPRLPGSDASSPLARMFGLDGDARGDTRLDILVLEGGEIRPLTSDVVLTPRQRLGFRYHGDGFLYVWVVEVRSGGEVVPLVPPHEDALDSYGVRAEPGGGLVSATSSVAPGKTPLTLYVLFTPVPVKLAQIVEQAKRNAHLGDPAAIANAIYFPGIASVRALARSE